MKMDNEIYDAGKWVVLIFMPAFAVFMSGLGELYQFAHMTEFIASINLFTAFLGTILQISSQKYKGGADDDSDDYNAC